MEIIIRTRRTNTNFNSIRYAYEVAEYPSIWPLFTSNIPIFVGAIDIDFFDSDVDRWKRVVRRWIMREMRRLKNFSTMIHGNLCIKYVEDRRNVFNTIESPCRFTWHDFARYTRAIQQRTYNDGVIVVVYIIICPSNIYYELMNYRSKTGCVVQRVFNCIIAQ